MDRTEKLLNIIDRLLSIYEYELVNEPFCECDECCDDLEDLEDYLDNIEEREDEDGGWEITETVVDKSPEAKQEVIDHLNNLIDLLCETFGFEKYEMKDGKLGVAYDKGLVEEIAKARKKLKK